MSFSDLDTLMPALAQQDIDCDALSTSHLIGALLAKLDIACGTVDSDLAQALARVSALKAGWKLALGGPLRENLAAQAYRSVMYYHQRTIRLQSLEDSDLADLLEDYLSYTVTHQVAAKWLRRNLQRVFATATKRELLLQLAADIPLDFMNGWFDNHP